MERTNSETFTDISNERVNDGMKEYEMNSHRMGKRSKVHFLHIFDVLKLTNVLVPLLLGKNKLYVSLVIND